MIADAPWIRDAEINGTPDCPEVFCPRCGASCETFFIFQDSIAGCEKCVTTTDALEWKEQWGCD